VDEKLGGLLHDQHYLALVVTELGDGEIAHWGASPAKNASILPIRASRVL
jgi:hypothetical protein